MMSFGCLLKDYKRVLTFFLAPSFHITLLLQKQGHYLKVLLGKNKRWQAAKPHWKSNTNIIVKSWNVNVINIYTEDLTWSVISLEIYKLRLWWQNSPQYDYHMGSHSLYRRINFDIKNKRSRRTCIAPMACIHVIFKYLWSLYRFGHIYTGGL